jgi:hypothetical protein
MWTGLDQRKRARRAEYRRQLIKDQIAGGTLTIRQATPEERERWAREREERQQATIGEH